MRQVALGGAGTLGRRYFCIFHHSYLPLLPATYFHLLLNFSGRFSTTCFSSKECSLWMVGIMPVTLLRLLRVDNNRT